MKKDITPTEATKRMQELCIKLCTLSQQAEALSDVLMDTLSGIESKPIANDLKGIYTEDVLNAPYIADALADYEWMHTNYNMVKAVVDMLNLNLAEAADELDAIT